MQRRLVISVLFHKLFCSNETCFNCNFPCISYGLIVFSSVDPHNSQGPHSFVGESKMQMKSSGERAGCLRVMSPSTRLRDVCRKRIYVILVTYVLLGPVTISVFRSVRTRRDQIFSEITYIIS